MLTSAINALIEILFSFGLEPILEKRSDIFDNLEISSSTESNMVELLLYSSRSSFIHPMSEDTGVPN